MRELAARDKKVVVINHTRNFGSQSAFTSGMRIATGDAVVLLDGDLQILAGIDRIFFSKMAGGMCSLSMVFGSSVIRQLFLQDRLQDVL